MIELVRSDVADPSKVIIKVDGRFFSVPIKLFELALIGQKVAASGDDK